EHKDEFSSEALDSLLDEEPSELPLKDDVEHKDEFSSEALDSLLDEEPSELPLKDETEHKDEFSSEALDSLLDEEPSELPLKDETEQESLGNLLEEEPPEPPLKADVEHKDEFSSETLDSLLDEESPELPLKADVEHKDEISSETLDSLLDEEPSEPPLKNETEQEPLLEEEPPEPPLKADIEHKEPSEPPLKDETEQESMWSLIEEESPEPPKAEHKDEISSEALGSLLDEEPSELPLKDETEQESMWSLIEEESPEPPKAEHKDEISSEALGSLLDKEPSELPLKDETEQESLGNLLEEEPPEPSLKDETEQESMWSLIEEEEPPRVEHKDEISSEALGSLSNEKPSEPSLKADVEQESFLDEESPKTDVEHKDEFSPEAPKAEALGSLPNEESPESSVKDDAEQESLESFLDEEESSEHLKDDAEQKDEFHLESTPDFPYNDPAEHSTEAGEEENKTTSPPLAIPDFAPEAFPMIEATMIKALKVFEQRSVTGMLEVRDCHAPAGIYFHEGRITHAYHGTAKGKKAFYRILSGKGGSLVFQPRSPAVEKTIRLKQGDALDFLLEEGNREIETLRRLNPATYEKYISINNDKQADIQNRKSLIYTLSLARKHDKVQDIIDASQMTDLQTYKHLLYLVQMGIFTASDSQEDTSNHTREARTREARIRIVIDSASDLPSDIVRTRNITLVPIPVSLNQRVWLDGADMTSSAFYHTLKNSKKSFPRVSAPSEEDFHQVFSEIAPDEDILAILMSGKINEAYGHAMAARQIRYEEYQEQRADSGGKDLRFEIIDSQLVSLGTGLLIIEAAEMAERGADIEEVRDYIEKLIPAIRVFFVADTSEYLQQGGWIGRSGGLVGNLLRTKPILAVRNGEVTEIDRVRGVRNAQKVVAELIRQSLPHQEVPIKAGVMHAAEPMLANQMRDLLENRFNCQSILMSNIGAAVGSHCGPGTFAVAYFPMTD
ncbi:DegV family protein, partial [Desulfococcaceae bacterium HSG8]|nr:DegV family protein [Desulfococcaceae bacterium HSG8]